MVFLNLLPLIYTPQAIQENIMEWVCLLHIRTPVCTVMLVASHYDMLDDATPEDNEQLLVDVGNG